MDKDENTAALFQRGGRCVYDGSEDLTGSGAVHILYRLGRYFKEHRQEEILRFFYRICWLHVRTWRSS
eukprot:579670-Prorocentrum_lima.AAC.1